MSRLLGVATPLSSTVQPAGLVLRRAYQLLRICSALPPNSTMAPLGGFTDSLGWAGILSLV